MKDKKNLYFLLLGLVLLFTSPVSAQLAGAGGSEQHLQMQSATEPLVISVAYLMTPDVEIITTAYPAEVAQQIQEVEEQTNEEKVTMAAIITEMVIIGKELEHTPPKNSLREK